VFFAANAGWGGSTAHMLVLLPFLLRRQGLPVDAVAALTAPTFLPLSLQFLWTPLLDVGLHRRSVFVGSTLLASALTLLSFWFLRGGHYAAMLAALLAVNTLYTVANTSLSLLVATTVPPARQGRAFALQCAASMITQGLVGTLLLALTDPPAVVVQIGRLLGLSIGPLPLLSQGLLLALLLVASGLSGLLIQEVEAPAPRLGAGLRRLLGEPAADILPAVLAYLRTTVANVAEETRRVFGSRQGIIGLLACLSPVGSAAASNLFGAIAPDFGAGAGAVSLTTGFGAALAMGAGSWLGGALSDRGDRRNGYLASGVALATVAVCMALMAPTPTTFVLCGHAYAVMTGLAYATYYPFVIDLIGSGPGMSTRYSICTGASNLAIYYVTMLEGAGYRNGGRIGLLAWDAALNMGGVLLVLGLSAVLLRPRRASELIVDPASVVQ
jgi:hypothetical protein